MKKIIWILPVLMLFIGLDTQAAVQDSVGTKVKNGKVFIMHKVEKSQGLFAISRRYGVPLDQIIAANPGSDEILHVDQVLLIPTGKDAPLKEEAVSNYFSSEKNQELSSTKPREKKTTFARYHTVEAGETLYSISVKYNTKVDVIKNLNGLESDILSIGQKLMVPATEEEKKSQQERIAEARQKLDDTESKLNEVRKASKKAKKEIEVTETKTAKYSIEVERLPKYDVEKVKESGVVSRYNLEDGENKRVCTHHTASVGSTIMVTNPVNNKSVFVKVISKHVLNEEKGDIIHLSETALLDIDLKTGERVQVSFAR